MALFHDSVNTQPIFDTHLDNAGCLTWRFPVISRATGDAFARSFGALEVEFHSTLACALQCMHATQSVNARIRFAM